LTGWKIDIKSESKMEKISGEILEQFKGLPQIGDVASRILYNEGFRSIKEVAEVDPEELARILGIEKAKGVEVVEAASKMVQGEAGTPKEEEAKGSAGSPALDPVERIEGVGKKTAELLEAHGFKKVQDLSSAEVEKLSDLPGIGAKKAEKLIQSAQHYAEGKGNE
jgi:N utilization substance protein A